ncbi:hypothetical protein DBB36_00745 [Flavobacterium sp. WLB]|uniref:hypothetical protein n=1 Tax=Flavobacterium sp. WLB TaxID=2161662 RepID=UPI000D3C5AED|nr:hypothetical protein [Flavobacterium sp. WLB]PUU71917.1 hypothetical protein DBB36_00745 [Flavobacterium sp. WLB]
MDTQSSHEPQSDTFETIVPEKDNPVRNSKLGTLATKSIKKMKLPEMNRVMDHLTLLNLPSENFNVLILKKNKKGTDRFAGIFLLC